MANQFANGTITTIFTRMPIRAFEVDGQRENSLGNTIGDSRLYRVLIGKSEDDTTPKSGRQMLASLNVFEASAMSGIRITKSAVAAFEKEHERLPNSSDFVSFKAVCDPCVPVARNAGAGKYVVPEGLNASGSMNGIANDCIIDYTHCTDIVFEAGEAVGNEELVGEDVEELPW
jgi:hypothetical protein